MMEGLREFFEVNGYVVELMICNFLFCLSRSGGGAMCRACSSPWP